MRVVFNGYETGNAVGGALYNYSEISKILKDRLVEDAQPVQHDFFSLLNASEQEQNDFVKGLNSTDLVFSNVGPLCFFYYYFREKYGGDFKIIRDVRTSSWAPYWLQEYIAGPLTRQGDIVIFPSDFCRQYYLHMFREWLSKDNTVVYYPLTLLFPEMNNKTRKRHLRLGYLGRMSSDKNIEQILNVYINVIKYEDKQAELHLAGPFGKRFSPDNIQRYFKRCGISSVRVFHYGRLPYHKIWEIYANIDVLLFPAVASVESLGRIIIESSRAQVPVVTAHYAAGPELLPGENLLKTYYGLSKSYDSRVACSIGAIDEHDAVNTILGAKLGADCTKSSRYNVSSFRSLLLGEFDCPVNENISPVVDAFIRSVNVTNAKQFNYAAAMHACGRLESIVHDNRQSTPLGKMLDKYNFWLKFLTSSMDEKKYQLHRVKLKKKLDERTMLDLAADYCDYMNFSPFFSIKPGSADDEQRLNPVATKGIMQLA